MTKNGFTLIELMVAIVISALLTGGGMVVYNSYNSREKTNQTAGEVVSYLNLAKSMALTNQTTNGFNGDLDYVAVQLQNGYIAAFPVNVNSGIGPSYFSYKITDNGATITPISLGMLQFGATTGKLLAKDPDPSFNASPLSPSDIGSSVVIVSNAAGDDKKLILVTPAGIIKLTAVTN